MIKLNKFKVLMIGVLVTIGMTPSFLWAWSSTNTKITNILTFSDGHVVVQFLGFTGNNACGSSFFSLGLAGTNTQSGMLPVALLAKITDASLTVATTPGQCDGGQEQISYIMTN